MNRAKVLVDLKHAHTAGLEWSAVREIDQAVILAVPFPDPVVVTTKVLPDWVVVTTKVLPDWIDIYT